MLRTDLCTSSYFNLPLLFQIDELLYSLYEYLMDYIPQNKRDKIFGFFKYDYIILWVSLLFLFTVSSCKNRFIAYYIYLCFSSSNSSNGKYSLIFCLLSSYKMFKISSTGFSDLKY